MIEYEVGIEERPLGVRFAHADKGETVVVHLVLENKVGHKLGLLPGDILIAINGQSVLGQSSAEALEHFRAQQLPFKASFRRFEDDDDFGSEEEENSDTDLQSHFQQEDANSIRHQLATQPKRRLPVEWTSAEVLEWLGHFGETHFDQIDRFEAVGPLFAKHRIDGKALLRVCEAGPVAGKQQLKAIGLADDDIMDIFRGIQKLHPKVFGVYYEFVPKGQLAQQLESAAPDGADGAAAPAAADDDAKGGGDDDEEEDNWEAPFLPYMYDAPVVALSARSTVKVYSARVVSPYKKRAFALYELEVAEGKEEWLLSKRYSEFYKLYDAMKRLGVKTKMDFPKKGIFYKSTDKQVMEDRKVQLTEYLNALLRDHPKARESKALSDFLSPSRTFVVDE